MVRHIAPFSLLHGVFGLLLAVGLAGLSTAEDWRGFRGPNQDGVSKDTKVPTEWSATKNLKWKLELPGKGFSSPIVVGSKVFVTAWSGGGSSVQRHILCVDRANGKVLWKKSIDGQSDGGDSGFAYHGNASHTPISDGERVYAMFGSSGIYVYDLDGKEIWNKQVGSERLARFGSASSPILHGDHVIVTAGCESGAIYAFKKTTGEEVWKAPAGTLSSTYSTPRIAKNADGTDELLISVPNEVWSLNPITGKLRWFAETRTDRAACPNVLVNDGVAYVVGGRSGGRAAIKLGGDADKGDLSKNVVWAESGGSYVPSPVLYKDHLYWVKDDGMAFAVNAKTGEQVTRKRIRGRFYGSATVIGDKLYVPSRFDGMYVLSATPEMEEISKNTLDDDSDFSASPAVSDGQLFIRSDKALYCIAAE